MKLKRFDRYQINFAGKTVTLSCALMGISLFLRAVYYFGFGAALDCTPAQWAFLIILPTVLIAVYIALMHCVRWNAPGVYGILACLFFLMLMGWNFTSGNVLRIVLSAAGYVLLSLIVLATSGGYIPGRFIAFISVFLTVLVRLLLFGLSISSWKLWLLEGSSLCILLALLCLPVTFLSTKRKAA